MPEAIFVGVFVFVTIMVAGWRALNRLAVLNAQREAEQARRVHYRGPTYSRHGREVY